MGKLRYRIKLAFKRFVTDKARVQNVRVLEHVQEKVRKGKSSSEYIFFKL